ncbi:hypothetical protein C2S51_001811 [Perilla frutescens var. frutescens]|nr:hypothetical protein C2S51_001811 [Perilla frutescens var. frutescens]
MPGEKGLMKTGSNQKADHVKKDISESGAKDAKLKQPERHDRKRRRGNVQNASCVVGHNKRSKDKFYVGPSLFITLLYMDRVVLGYRRVSRSIPTIKE